MNIDQEIKPAAVVIILGGEKNSLVYLVQREGGFGFLKDSHLFPGRKVEKRDVATASHFPLEQRDQDLIYRLAGIRKTAEESGLIFARQISDGSVVKAKLAGPYFQKTSERSRFL